MGSPGFGARAELCFREVGLAGIARCGLEWEGPVLTWGVLCFLFLLRVSWVPNCSLGMYGKRGRGSPGQGGCGALRLAAPLPQVVRA